MLSTSLKYSAVATLTAFGMGSDSFLEVMRMYSFIPSTIHATTPGMLSSSTNSRPRFTLTLAGCLSIGQIISRRRIARSTNLIAGNSLALNHKTASGVAVLGFSLIPRTLIESPPETTFNRSLRNEPRGSSANITIRRSINGKSSAG